MPVQPSRWNATDVPISDAIVMPLVGFDVTPTRPTIRDDTVTKKNANTTTHTAATARTGDDPTAPKTCGTSANTPAMISSPKPTVFSERSSPVRGTVTDASPSRSRSCRVPMRKLSTIVGMLRISVIRPAAATAPAPM